MPRILSRAGHRRVGGRKKSRVQLGLLPFVVFVSLVVATAIFAEIWIEPLLRPARMETHDSERPLPATQNVVATKSNNDRKP